MAPQQAGVQGGSQASMRPAVKEEPAETRGLFDLPEADRRSQGNSTFCLRPSTPSALPLRPPSLPSRPPNRGEGSDRTNPQIPSRPPKVPFRPPTHNSANGAEFEPPADIISLLDSTPFPRALHKPSPPTDTSAQPKTDENTEQRRLPAPIKRESREERFKKIFLGHLGVIPKRNPTARKERDSTMPSQNRGQSLGGNNAHPRAEPGRLPSSPVLGPRPGSHNFGDILPTRLLLDECLARRFNPRFIMTVTADGMFACDIKLLQAVVKGDRLHNSEMAAKCAVAEKALAVVQSSRLSQGISPPPSYRPRQEGTWLNRVHGDLAHESANVEQNVTRMSDGRAFRPADCNWNRNHDMDRAADQANLIDRVRNAVTEDSFMFLEGLVTGARAASLFAPIRRNRSPSPQRMFRPLPTNQWQSHRERSPISNRRSAYFRERSPTYCRPSANYRERSPSPRRNGPSPTRSGAFRAIDRHGEIPEWHHLPPGALRWNDSYRPTDSYVPDYSRGRHGNERPRDRYHY